MLAAPLFASAAPAATQVPSGALGGVGTITPFATSEYRGWHWANPDPVDSYVTSDGELAVVKHGHDRLSIDTYDPATLSPEGKTTTIDLSGWPDWGGFYAAPDGDFYVLVGRDNPDENDDLEVVAVRRYDASWNRLGTAYIKGGATQHGVGGIYKPFVAGDPHMVLADGRLVVHMSRLIYAEPYHGQIVHHQVNLTFEVDTDTMTATTFDQLGGSAYASHSWQQLVAMNGNDLVTVDHGDAYPRAIQLGVMADYPSSRAVATYDLFDFNGAVGDNFTGASVTDLISGPGGVVVLGNSIPQPDAPGGTLGSRDEHRNVFAISADPATGAHTTNWLTQFAPDSQGTVVGPRVVRVDTDRFAVLFGVQGGGHSRLEYRLMTSSGKVLARETFPAVFYASINAPVHHGDDIYWVGTNPDDDSDAYVYKLNITDPAAPKIIAARRSCTSKPFADVPADSTFCGDIAWLSHQDITGGYDDGGFHPRAQVTRQAMAAFLYRLQNPGKADPACTGGPFDDVPASNPFCGDIAWLSHQDITRGYDDGGFHPDAVVSRQVMAAFLYRLQNPGTGDPACTGKPFSDVPADSPFCGDVAWLKTQQVTTGDEDGDFRPAAPVSRQAMAAFLYRL
jgi:hypothetical protein